MSTAQQLTIENVMTLLGATRQTVYNWRQGSATKEPLAIAKNVEGIRFPAKSTVKWAEKHGLALRFTVEDVLSGKADKIKAKQLAQEQGRKKPVATPPQGRRAAAMTTIHD